MSTVISNKIWVIAQNVFLSAGGTIEVQFHSKQRRILLKFGDLGSNESPGISADKFRKYHDEMMTLGIIRSDLAPTSTFSHLSITSSKDPVKDPTQLTFFRITIIASFYLVDLGHLSAKTCDEFAFGDHLTRQQSNDKTTVNSFGFVLGLFPICLGSLLCSVLARIVLSTIPVPCFVWLVLPAQPPREAGSRKREISGADGEFHMLSQFQWTLSCRLTF
jgi:hypothetical protein